MVEQDPAHLLDGLGLVLQARQKFALSRCACERSAFARIAWWKLAPFHGGVRHDRLTQVRVAEVVTIQLLVKMLPVKSLCAGRLLREVHASQHRLELWILVPPLVPFLRALAQLFHVSVCHLLAGGQIPGEA